MFRPFTLETFSPRGMMRMALGIAQQSAEMFRTSAPGAASRAAWRELQNKLEVFELFEHVDSVLRIPSGTDFSLTETVQKAQRLGTFTAVWATEGLGHDYTDTYWKRRLTPHRILSDVSDLPEKSLVALHAGMGLSVAQHLIRKLTPQTSSAEVRRTLHRFIGLCQDNSESGYEGAAYESLGLVARNIYPQLVRVVDEELGRMNRQVQAYFWHGVGRAIYFGPTNFLPYSGVFGRALGLARREPPRGLGQRNAVAGLAWASTLVNIRHPEVMESILDSYGELLSQSDAFRHGVTSALMIWYDSTETTAQIKAFRQHATNAADPKLRKLWDSQIGRACHDALAYYPELKRRRRLGDLFRYGSMAELVE